MIVQQIIDAILAYSAPSVKLDNTCDTLKSGGPETEVIGVVTTFMATVDVIRRTADLGANLIITHEPTWFSGKDDIQWLKDDPVYREKRGLIAKNNIAIWRYHDYMHFRKPDAVYEGLIKTLGWEEYAAKPPPVVTSAQPGAFPDFAETFQDYYDIPETTLGGLAVFFKEKLTMETARIIGDPDMPCGRVGILVGGGSLGLGDETMPMRVMRAHDIHVMVCGDITEWTLPAYVNDAQQLGHRRALLIVGHERSEEWGMKYMAAWLPGIIEGIPVYFVDAKEPFGYI